MQTPEKSYRVDQVSVADTAAFEALPEHVRELAYRMHALWTDNAPQDEPPTTTDLEQAWQEGYDEALDNVNHALRNLIKMNGQG